jgi:hypothetical protein
VTRIEPSERAAPGTVETIAQRAERYVYDLLRSALLPEYVLLRNVAWLVRDHGTDREGEADLIIAHPDHGFLTIEVKSGPISRDSQGRWWAGGRVLEQAAGRQSFKQSIHCRQCYHRASQSASLRT